MQRFSVYAIPFVTLTVLFYMKHSMRHIGRWTYLPWHGKIPFVAAFGLCLCTSMFTVWDVYANLDRHAVFDARHLNDWRALNRILPEDARVAAPWNAAEVYAWAAPQARYLNVLDPLFMAVPHPRLYSIQRNIWQGDEPDVPLVVQKYLKSDYIAFPYAKSNGLFDRLSADPRARLLYKGNHVLFRIDPRANEKFIRDWKVIPNEGKWPLDVNDIVVRGKNYPKLSDPVGIAYEGYIDGLRTHPAESCMNFVHIEEVAEPTVIEYELSAYGQSRFWHNGELLVTNLHPTQATLGQGVRFNVRLEKGLHTFSVQTCAYQGHIGFYFLERNRSPLNDGTD
jgi:hypothetical protein